MENKQFEPSYWVIIRNNKKYLGCQNDCKHLENIDNIWKRNKRNRR